MSLSPSAQRVQDALIELGTQIQVRELPASTRTAAEAAQAVGCALGQIVKSLVFRGVRSGQAILVETSGANRVSESNLAGHLGEEVRMASAEFVRLHTGFAIGGVPPLAHASVLRTYIDRDLMDYEEIWAAAGTPQALFALTPQQLVDITQGEVVEVKAIP
jgi:prolyl-tRNA editing enzyme YbaK/EbsC (Cys-tRNA(Pro) deacylase)